MSLYFDLIMKTFSFRIVHAVSLADDVDSDRIRKENETTPVKTRKDTLSPSPLSSTKKRVRTKVTPKRDPSEMPLKQYQYKQCKGYGGKVGDDIEVLDESKALSGPGSLPVVKLEPK